MLEIESELWKLVKFQHCAATVSDGCLQRDLLTPSVSPVFNSIYSTSIEATVSLICERLTALPSLFHRVLPTQPELTMVDRLQVVEPTITQERAIRQQLTNYLGRFSSPEYFDHPESWPEIFRFDFEHIIKEALLSELHTTFSYSLNCAPDANDAEGLRGDGYGQSESMDALHANFITHLANDGQEVSRAAVEYLVFAGVRQTFIEHARHQLTLDPRDRRQRYLIVTSPPDSTDHGYHGIDTLHPRDWSGPESHHSFIFLMRISQLTDDGMATIEVDQLRTWHNMQGLINLHRALNRPLTPDINQPITCQLFANVVDFEQAIDIPHHQVLQQLQDALYQPAVVADWVQPIDALPLLEQSQLNQFWQEIFGDQNQPQPQAKLSRRLLSRRPKPAFFTDFFLPTALPHLQVLAAFKHSNQISLDQYYADEHSTPPTKIVNHLSQLELAFTYFFSTIEKRVREMNRNPRFEQAVVNRVRHQINQAKLKNESSTLIAQLRRQLAKPRPISLAQKTPQLLRMHTIQSKIVNQEPVSNRDRRWFNRMAPHLLSIMGTAAGSAQCYALAPFTTALSLVEQGGQSINNLRPDMMAIFVRDNVPTLDLKVSLLHRLEHDYLECWPDGADEPWMVPREYLFDDQGQPYLLPNGRPACFVDDQGQLMGFCPLPEGMKKTTYLALIRQLHQDVERQQLDELDTLIQDQTNDATNRQPYRRLFHKLKQALFKPTITFSDLLAGNVLDVNIALVRSPHQAWLGQLIIELHSSHQPLRVFEERSRAYLMQLGQDKHLLPGV